MDLATLPLCIQDEPHYRARQIKLGVFVDLAEDWNDLTALPKKLREKLQKNCSLRISAELFPDKNVGAVKALIRLADGKRIETVLMRRRDGRNTVCVSCQVGCPMGCTFCATGKMKLLRSLQPYEIVEQVVLFARYLKTECARVSNVVFMGMGEPFANYDNALEAVRVLNDHDGLNIGARHISLSTCGILKGIQRLAKEPLQVNLALSLHAPDDATRRMIMPVSRSYTITALLAGVDAYTQATHRKVMFEYLLLGGVNDTDTHARALAKLLTGRLCMVNLIAYNATGMYASATKERMHYFSNVLQKAGIEATIRYRHGREVRGACGQLATSNEDFMLPSDVVASADAPV